MEYHILKHMRQKRLPTQACLTVKFYLATVLIITLHSIDVSGSTLGSKCQHDMDCTDFIKGSSCSALGYCECAPYYVQYNTTTCLSSQLLGGDCTLNEQCTMKVANSSCLDGACRCVEGFLQFRKHTCLGPAPPGSVCYSHAHCQMFNERTHCDFLIPNLFGRCQCTAPAKLKAGLCLEEAASTTTTSAPVQEMNAAVSSTEQQHVSTESVVEENKIVMAETIAHHLQQQPEDNLNAAIEEQNLGDDKNAVQLTTQLPIDIQGGPLTPAKVDEDYQQVPTEDPDNLDIPNVTEDYPYKIEEDYQTDSHKPEVSGDHVEESSTKEEEHVEDYGHVIDNTMNFDYEAAQQEMEEQFEEQPNLQVEQESAENLQHQELQQLEQQTPEPENHKIHEQQETEQYLDQQPQQVDTQEHEQHYHHVSSNELESQHLENHNKEHQIELELQPETENEPAQKEEYEAIPHPESEVHQEEISEPKQEVQDLDHQQDNDQYQVEEGSHEQQETEPETVQPGQEQVHDQIHPDQEEQDHPVSQESSHEPVQEHELSELQQPEEQHHEPAQIHEDHPENVHEPISEQEIGDLAQVPDGEHGLQSPVHEAVETLDHYLETELEPESETETEQIEDQPSAQQHEEIGNQIHDEKPAIEQSNESIKYDDDKHHAAPQHAAELDNVAQVDHTIPDNKEIENMPPKQHQQNEEDNEEENFAESLNLPSITNEIYNDLTNEVAAENESVQNENEAATQQQPEAATPANNEVITTQSAVLEENDNDNVPEADVEINSNNNKEIDVNTIPEHQQLVADSTPASAESIVDNEKAALVSQQIEENNVSEPLTASEEEQPQQLETLQEITEKTPEIENYTDADHLVIGSLEQDHDSKENDISTELSLEADQIGQNVSHVEQQPDVGYGGALKPVLFEDKIKEELPVKEGNVEEVKDEISEAQNISEEKGEKIEPLAETHTEHYGEQEEEEEEETPDQFPHLEEHAEEEEREEEVPLIQNSFLATSPSSELSDHTENYIEQAVDSEESHKEVDVKYEEAEAQQNQHHGETSAQSTENPHKEEEHSNVDVNANLLSDNEDDNFVESTTLTTEDVVKESTGPIVENIEINQNNEASVDNPKNEETLKQQESTDIKESNNEVSQEEQTFPLLNKEKDPSMEANQPPVAAEVNSFDSEAMTGDEEVQQVTEAFDSNYVPSKTDKDSNEQAAEVESFEMHNKPQTDNPHSAPMQDSFGQAEKEENVNENQPADVYLAQNQTPDLSKTEQNEEFKESESISDILNNLMKEDITLPPEYSEDSSYNHNLQSMHESDVQDLLAEDTNISEESVLSHQLATKDSTGAPIDPEDKLITFYPDMQEVQPVQQLPITSEQEIEESSGDGEKAHLEDNEIIQIGEQHTLSPLDLPFDTSMDYQPQQFEADNLVVETTTISDSELNLEENNEKAEATTAANDLEEFTTHTTLHLASRVTLMEPAAPVSTTVQPLTSADASDEMTPAHSIDAPLVESLLTTKPTAEIRKRVEMSLEAVSLGLSCSNDKQCQLADPHTTCNARGVCDCAANADPSGAQNEAAFAQCGAERTGCAAGTFQCRSSGVCISWFFVCDGRSDCNDASDEECTLNARLNQTCPSQAFVCGRSGRCISRAALCDGRKQCPHGEDEVGCNVAKSGDSCPPHTFRCKSGECLPEYEYCNAIISCRDGSDEPPHLCGSRSVPNFFMQLLTAGGLMNKNTDSNVYCPHRCSNGRCRSTAIVCSGRDGCGDGTDEQTCSVCRCPAVSMDRPTNNVSEFLARHRPMVLW